MRTFLQYMELIEASRAPGSKSGLYPLAYNGIGLYTPADILTHAADAIYYLSQDQRLFRGHDGSPFNITHLPGDIIPHRQTPLEGETRKPSESPLPDDTVKPGNVSSDGIVPFKSWVKLVTKPELLDPNKEPSQKLVRWD